MMREVKETQKRKLKKKGRHSDDKEMRGTSDEIGKREK